MAAIAAAGASVVWCPESNRNLYGTTADVRAVRGAGDPVGLGSDSPVSGVRDALSSLAAARREGVADGAELVELATRGAAAAVARLPVGGLAVGDRADLMAVPSLDALLAGNRGAVDLVIRQGRASYASPALGGLVPAGDALRVDGQPRLLARGLGRRAASILKAHPRVREAAWITGLEWGAFD